MNDTGRIEAMQCQAKIAQEVLEEAGAIEMKNWPITYHKETLMRLNKAKSALARIVEIAGDADAERPFAVGDLVRAHGRWNGKVVRVYDTNPKYSVLLDNGHSCLANDAELSHIPAESDLDEERPVDFATQQHAENNYE